MSVDAKMGHPARSVRSEQFDRCIAEGAASLFDVGLSSHRSGDSVSTAANTGAAQSGRCRNPYNVAWTSSSTIASREGGLAPKNVERIATMPTIIATVECAGKSG